MCVVSRSMDLVGKLAGGLTMAHPSHAALYSGVYRSWDRLESYDFIGGRKPSF
jgi:hypothetical protein